MLADILYRHSRYFALVVMVIVIVGVASLRSLGRQEDPSITNLRATVTTFFPGANPARVEALVSRPLEDRIREVAEVTEVDSTSSTGVSVLSIEVDDTMGDEEIERSWTEIRDAVNDAVVDLPPGASKPEFDNEKAVANTRLVAVRPAPGAAVPLSIIKRVAEDFADQARNFPGTRLVRMVGEPEEEIRVELDEQATVSRGLSVDAVASALAAADAKMNAGRASGSTTDFLIEVAGDFDSLNRVRDVIVVAPADGRVVRISDIARVYKAEVSPPRSVALVEGERGIILGIAMQEGLQVDQWSQRFDEMMSAYRQQAPSGVIIETSYDQSGYTSERLAGVLENLLLGIVLVILVLLVTLGWRAALVVAAILPLCTLLSLSVLFYIGLPIHQMSVTGLVVALGLLVDGSIVMTDEIRKRMMRGLGATEAIRASVDRMRLPLFTATATTVLTFIPMIILPGPAGDFLGSIAKAVVVMLVASLFLALLVTPVLAAWLLPGGLQRSTRHWWDLGIDSGRLGRHFSRALDWSLRHPWGSVALALVLPISGFLAFPTLTAQFFPGVERDQLYLQVKLPDGRPLQETLAMVREMDDSLREHANVRRVDWVVGESAPAFYYNMIGSNNGIPSWAEALVLTHDASRTDALINTLQGQLDSAFPAARVVVRGIDQGPPVAAPLEIELYGPNLDVLRQLGEQFRLRMERLGDVTHSTTSLVAGAPKLVFELDQNKLRLAQLSLADVSRSLDAALQGRIGGELLEDTERLPVRARLSEAEWGDVDQVANIRLPVAGARAGDQLPGVALSTLGSYQLQPSRSPIQRSNGERLNTVQGFLTRGVLAEEALKQLLADLALDPIALPQGYRYAIGGDADSRSETVQNLVAPIGLVLALLVAAVVVTFNSWRLSAVAFGVCICSLGLSLLSLAVFNYPFGVQALIGVIGSVGVSINAAIIIMTALQLDPEASGGKLTAMRNVVMDSSRHIVSTTITTFGGFLPLILAGGAFWPPFAMAIAGGVLLSTIVSFFLVPPLFLLVYPRNRVAAGQPLALAELAPMSHQRLAG